MEFDIINHNLHTHHLCGVCVIGDSVIEVDCEVEAIIAPFSRYVISTTRAQVSAMPHQEPSSLPSCNHCLRDCRSR